MSALALGWLNGESHISGVRTAPIFTRLVNFCWSLFQWCLFLAIVGALAVGGYLYFRLDDEIRRQVERRLADFYRDFDVRVGSARFDADRGIAISDLKFTQKLPDRTSQPILAIEEMYMAGKVRMDQLVTGQMPIDDMTVRGAKLRLVRQEDGKWNASALLPMPKFGNQSPKVKIEDASATIEDATTPALKPWAINGVNLQLEPAPAGTSGDGGEKRLHLDGTATGLPAKEVRVVGEVGTTNGQFDLSLIAVGLEISPDIVATLPSSMTTRLRGADFSGRADVAVRLSRSAPDAAVAWSGSIKLDRGRIAHPSLPEPLTEVSLVGRLDPNRLLIEQFNGKCGSATVAAAIDRAGWSANAPLGLAAKVVGFTIDERMRSVLPEHCARVWDRFKPTGTVDADVRVTFDGKKWRPVLSADCRGISLTDAEKFPYTLVQTTGRVEYRPAENGKYDQLRLDLTGVGGGRPIRVEAELRQVARADEEEITTGSGVASAGQLRDPDVYSAGFRGVRFARGQTATASHPMGFVKISGSDIPIHEQLLAALPPNAQSLTRSLQPQGAIDFTFRAEWKDTTQPRADVTQEIRLKDCRIQFVPFPYPLQHVNGLARENNSIWKLEDIDARGANDTTIVKCRGEATPDGGGYKTDLFFNALNVPLDDTLKDSLPPAGQQAWDDLRPQGRVNFDAHATKQAGLVEPVIEVVLKPCEKSVSVEPKMFLYRFEQVDGEAAYRKGHVDLRKISALHDRTLYSAESGVWQASPDGGWQLGLTNVTADRLAVSRDLLIALPPGLQSMLERFQPSGTFALHNSNLSFAKSPQAAALASAWDINLECQQTAIQGAVPLRGVTGGMHLVGRSDGRSAVSVGELAIDSLLWKDMQFTNVRGPLWADGKSLLLGEPACRQQNQPPRRLTADAYGGSLAANIELLNDSNPSYKVDAHVGGANLARFANERLGGANDVSGTVSGKLFVTGTGQTTQTMQGAGEMHVVDGHIYQLPLLVSLLKVLSNRPPDSTAFNRCDMQFSIQGEFVRFQQLNLIGDAVSLYGQGEATFNRKLDLVFYTLIGPADFQIPLLKTLAGHVSQQGLQLKVVGTLDDPKIERKALPAVNDMLDHIQNELQGGAATMTPGAAAFGGRAPGK